MLAAQYQQAHGLGGGRGRVAQTHQPQRAFVNRLPCRRDTDPG